jgi:hypothetical protein
MRIRGNRVMGIGVLAAAVTCSLAFAQKGYIRLGTLGEITRPDLNQLWRQPDIQAENLLYGIGGLEHAPHGPFTFQKEDLKGSNPKFVVRDADGVRWKVKLGAEAQPETAASRFVWAVGYYADDDYFVPELQVLGLPKHLHRGQDLVENGGIFHGARLKREQGEKKVGGWAWRDNRFAGTKEMDGLRVMMALIDNWDLKNINNAVRDVKEKESGTQREFLVSDLGASFGTTGIRVSHDASKGNVDAYKKAQFITDVGSETVSFAVPSRPAALEALDPHDYVRRVDLEWIGKDIPIQHVRWITSLLSQLSDQQIRDAFRAAGYLGPDLDGFTFTIEHRIAELKKL